MTTEPNVTDKQLRQLGLICIAIATAGTIMCLVAIFIGQGNMDPLRSVEDLQTIRFVHLILAVVSIFSARLIGEKVISGKIQTVGQPLQPFFQRYQSSVIVQLASIEGVVLFGAVIVMMTPASLLASDATYYLHLTPVVLLILRAQQLYPTRDKIEMLARSYQQ